MKIKCLLMGILLAWGTLFFFGCDESGSTQILPLPLSGGEKYAIGDTGPSGVGIVFYISDGGRHGLEAAPSLWDEDPDMDGEDPYVDWSNITSTAIGSAAQGTVIGTGAANTIAIITQTSHTTSAAQLCRDYFGGGKLDWYLPTSVEFDALGLALTTVGGFSDEFYWTSHENSATLAEVYDVHTGGRGGNNKSSSSRVRPIRAF